MTQQGRLEKFYEDTFGTPQSRGELYTGFFLIITGFVLSLVGVLIFVGIARQFTGATEYDWKETGGVIASLGPAAILIGISVTLPTKWTMRVLDGVGAILCLAGTATFMYLYPLKWNTGGGEEMWGVLLYVGGLAALLASTISSLIGYYVSRFAFASGAGGHGGVDVTASEYNYDIPDSVIEKDIELAMRRYNVSWGGEGADAQGKSSVQFDVRDEFTPGTVIGGKGVARSVTLDAPQVDTATDKLRGLRAGRGTGTVESKAVDDTTAALLKFRQQKAAQVAAKEAARRRGFWAWLRSLFSRKKPTPSGAPSGAIKAPPSK